MWETASQKYAPTLRPLSGNTAQARITRPITWHEGLPPSNLITNGKFIVVLGIVIISILLLPVAIAACAILNDVTVFADNHF